ncbi:MAG TPA: hypothetical protein VMR90_13785 [Candidatus Cybelea sp.]|nr:hypothetical protein [Candidatus Cybelea sp.]
MKIAIVTTTINVPEFLDGYCRDFFERGRKDLCFVVVGDKKTPPEAEQYCSSLNSRYGFPMEFFSLWRQRDYLRRFPELDQYLPYDSVQRRNIGMLYAYELGCQLILTVDDDNYVLQPDLLDCHLRTDTQVRLKAFSSSSGWMNPCQFLSATPQLPFYHRGFPISKRFIETTLSESWRSGRLVANVGMWLGDPDVDAWVRMTVPLEATQWMREENIILEPGTWAPFNSQQTTLTRDLVPAYFLNPNAGRYDDIWASYVLHRIANHFGDLISYGFPVVSHIQKRSLASLWRDLEEERMGALLTDAFVAMLRSAPLRSATYAECYAELADWLTAEIDKSSLPSFQQDFLREFARGMHMWIATFSRLAAHPALVEPPVR